MKSEFPPSVEQRAEEESNDMFEILFEHADRPGAVFIDRALENDVFILEYAEYLAGVLCDDKSDEQVKVTYRAIHFMSMVTALHGCNKGMIFDSMLNIPRTDIEDAREYIRQIADEYGERCPTVMGYADACMPEIDPSGEHGYLAETVAGLVGSHIDDKLQARAAARRVAEWDGVIPDDFV